jgi:hypothetical protein
MSAGAAAAGMQAGADRHLIASIGDEVGGWRHHYCDKLVQLIRTMLLACWLLQDTITGLLLAGTGHISEKGKKNFLVVNSSV